MIKTLFLSWTILSFTLIALPGWARNSKVLMGSEPNLANVLNNSNFPDLISINQVQKLPQTAGSRLANNLIIPPDKEIRNAAVQQKSTSRSSPQRGAPKPKRDRD
ncbi:hypothetical protein Cri9333_3964 [Crinalium epipsammum PCC 9333]|uniref:Uncharacterized protein n=1 Tax=Crinalium epipsammum PCC 9333 TaxID=1173022 RepID=K9W3J1_9CYAN|nr:hypothetical protein [Crinalium epipsammum]AFZ14771.1 hypothetical protein Cri9333_3964 [Crinalium epipsammum PCC 9333]